MESGPGKEPLSRRELQVAHAYVAGRTYRQIADELHIAPATVRTHLSNIYRKLEVSNKIELLHRIDPQAAVAPPNTGRPHLVPLLAGTGGVTAFGLLAAVLTYSAPVPAAVPPAAQLDRVALVPFRHDGDEVARDTVVGELVAGLTRHTDLQVVRSGRLSIHKLPEPYARDLSRFIDTRYVLFGQVASGERGLVVSAALFDGHEDQVVWRKEVQSQEQNSLTLRLELMNSLGKTISLPATRDQPARCLEMLEFAGSESTRPLYRFETAAPLYCPSNRSGPR